MSVSKIPEASTDGSSKCPEEPMTITPMSKSNNYTDVHNWKLWVRRCVYVTYFTFMALLIPILIWELVKKGAEFEIIIWFLAGLATVFAVPISLWGILNHLIYFTQPKLQRHILRILWMVPIYGTFSWLALSFPVARVYLDAVREIYQAYVIYNFITYLTTFLTDEYDMETRMKEKKQVKSPPPCCCCKAGKNELVINRCKYGTLNYVVSRPILTIVSVICEVSKMNYEDGSLSIGVAWIWITAMLAISQLWAIFCLVLLYKSTREELQPLYKPHAQFLCIKMTIFGANFQGLIIAVLVSTGALKPKDSWGLTSDAEFAALIQDFVVCFEMVIASFAHAYSFPHKPYKTMGERLPFLKALGMMFWPKDVFQDFWFHIKRVGRKVRRKFTKTPKKDTELVINEVIQDDISIDNDDEGFGDGDLGLGTVTQINDVNYSINGKIKTYPKPPADNEMAPRGGQEDDAIVDILGQAEATLEANAIKDAAGKNIPSGSFGSDGDATDLGMGSVVTMPIVAPVGNKPKRRLSKKGGMIIDYGMDADEMTFNTPSSLMNDSEA